MKLIEETIRFIKEHEKSDVTRLLLDARKFPGVDVPFAVEQILARRQVKDKLPHWYCQETLIYPSRISAEQCSSEYTARYKQNLVPEHVILCDLTGGLGIDSFYFSAKVQEVLYLERYPAYCEAARNNFDALHAGNIRVIETDSVAYVKQMQPVDIFFVDPARRGEGDKRVFALKDCEPDLLSLKPFLFEKASRIIAKISPMADIKHTLSLLPETTEVHVLSVKNECKELLFVMERNSVLPDPDIFCVNFKSGEQQSFHFTFHQEQHVTAVMADVAGSYLYEPNASILKAGAFKCIASRMNLQKLHVNSHLYTSEVEVPDFPGRIFRVEDVLEFNSQLCKSLNRTISEANITVRNFPLSADQLRKRLKIKDGGAVYLFATIIAQEEKVLLKCKKIK